LFLKNDEKFLGEFKDDLIEGKGVYYFSDGNTIVGHWK